MTKYEEYGDLIENIEIEEIDFDIEDEDGEHEKEDGIDESSIEFKEMIINSLFLKIEDGCTASIIFACKTIVGLQEKRHTEINAPTGIKLVMEKEKKIKNIR